MLASTLAGQYRLCLGYTEPEGGSDVATCKTRAVRDGDGWIINGAMFTSTRRCLLCLPVTNTDPGAPKHQSLTMFLVPLNRASRSGPSAPWTAIAPNITYYSDVRVDDRYSRG